MSIDKGIDPASLPTRDGKPVLPGEEIAVCGTCCYCRLRLDDAKEPYSACTYKGTPNYKRYIGQIFPVDPEQPGCAKWRLAFQNYAEQLKLWRRKKWQETDFDCQREEQEYRRKEAQDHATALSEEIRKGFGPKPRPILGG